MKTTPAVGSITSNFTLLTVLVRIFFSFYDPSFDFQPNGSFTFAHLKNIFFLKRTSLMRNRVRNLQM